MKEKIKTGENKALGKDHALTPGSKLERLVLLPE